MKKVRDGYKMTELGEIPIEWQIKSINDICYVNPDTLSNKSDDSLSLEYIDIESVTTRRINEIKKLEFKDAPSRARRLIKRNDVIMSTVRPYLKAFAKINIEKDNLVCSTGFAVLRAKKNINHEFLFQSILSDYYIQQLSNKMVGSNYPAVNSSDVRESNIILPPLEEQEKIASILSTVDEQIDNVDALIEKNKELKKGLMQTLLTKGIGHTKFKKTEIGEIPEEWEVIKFDNIISFLTDYEANGSFSSIKENVNIFDEPNYAYFVRATDLEKKDYINSVKYVDKESYKFLSKTSLNGGELLIAKRGQIGKVYLMPNLDKKATLAPNLYLIKLDNEKANNKYVYYYFISSIGQKRLISNSASTTLGAIYKDDVKKIKMVLPSIKEQEKIVLILSEIDEKIDGYENRREKLEELKKGLMQQLLTGRIRVI